MYLYIIAHFVQKVNMGGITALAERYFFFEQQATIRATKMPPFIMQTGTVIKSPMLIGLGLTYSQTVVAMK